MKKWILKLSTFAGLYFAYKIILFTSVLLLAKAPLHEDLGRSGNNQVVIAGSSNVYFSYNYELLNKDSLLRFRSCWVPASYGVGLMLSKLDGLVNSTNTIVVAELPYHWFLADQMAPHDYSFYSRATPNFFEFFIHHFPLDFVFHFLQYSVINHDLYEYYWRQSNFPLNVERVEKLREKGEFDETYYSCQPPYNKAAHFVLSSQFQEFQFREVDRYLRQLVSKNHLIFYYSYPPIERNNYKLSPKLIASLSSSAILPFDSCLWDRKYLFDMRYHLNDCGAKLNSIRLRKLLERVKH